MKSRLANAIGYVPLLVVAGMASWFHATVFPRVSDGAKRFFQATRLPVGFEFVSDHGWFVYVLLVALALAGVLSLRFETLARGWAIGLSGGVLSLVLALYGFGLSTPLLMQVLTLGENVRH